MNLMNIAGIAVARLKTALCADQRGEGVRRCSVTVKKVNPDLIFAARQNFTM